MSPAGAYEVLSGAVAAAGGSADEETPDTDRQAAPWESSMEALNESLAMRGVLDNLERRSAEDELGATAYADSPVHARPALATAHTLLDRGVIGEDELREKMAEVRARFETR